jgi:GAF domain-containing protein
MLVTDGATAAELFTAVVGEVVAVLDVPAGWLFRYEPDSSVSVLASLNDPGFPVGSRWQLDGPSLSATILETGQPARIDDYSQLGGSIAAAARESGYGSAFGAPITVGGVVWGLICVGTTESEPLPADTEARLRDFTELVATAISKAQADDDLRRLARQQAGWRRSLPRACRQPSCSLRSLTRSSTPSRFRPSRLFATRRTGRPSCSRR